MNRLSDLVAYQRGRVVSRTVIDKQIGTITLFSFNEGQGLSEHTAPFDALVYLLDGEAEISISGTSPSKRRRNGYYASEPAPCLKGSEKIQNVLNYDTILIGKLDIMISVEKR